MREKYREKGMVGVEPVIADAEAAEVFSRGFLSGWLGGGDSQGSPPWNLHTHTHTPLQFFRASWANLTQVTEPLVYHAASYAFTSS